VAGPSTFLLSRIHRSDCEKSSPKFNRLNSVILSTDPPRISAFVGAVQRLFSVL
jgi:hypothetical protein